MYSQTPRGKIDGEGEVVCVGWGVGEDMYVCKKGTRGIRGLELGIRLRGVGRVDVGKKEARD